MRISIFCYVSIVLSFSLPHLVSAQSGGRLSYEKYPTIKKTTMLVVLDSLDEAYNESIQAIVETNWKITPFKFIRIKELPKYSRDSQYSMLIRDQSEKIRRTAASSNVIRRNHLALYHCDRGPFLQAYGGKEAVTQLEFVDVADSKAYLYKLPALVQAMQNYLTFLDTASISEDTYDYKLEHFQNAKAGELKDMTILANLEDLPEGMTIADIKDVYPYNFVAVNQGAIEAAINDQQADIAFLHLGPQVDEIYVISAKGGNVLFRSKPADHHTFGKADLRKLVSTIEKPPVLEETWSEKLDKVGNLFKKKPKKKKEKKKASGE